MKGMGKSTPKCRIICGEEQLKILYARRYINPVLNATPNLMGLQEVYESWQGLPKITEHKRVCSVGFQLTDADTWAVMSARFLYS